MSALCVLPSEARSGCCTQAPLPPAAPVRPDNEPNRASIAYRVGAFGSFRRAIIAELEEFLPGWRASVSQDYATTVAELWAYVADILTFYQERIANEAFIRTATQFDSLIRLAELVGYRPDPGASATAVVAFILDKGKTATLKRGMRVGAKPAAGKPASVFELSAALTASASVNKLPLAATAPARLFADLTSLVTLFGASGDRTPADATGNEDAIADVFPSLAAYFDRSVPAAESRTSTQSSTIPVGPDARTITLLGTKLKLAAGSYLLIDDQGSASHLEVRRITDVRVDRARGMTDVTFFEKADCVYGTAQRVFAMRAIAAPFGANAPPHDTLSALMKVLVTDAAGSITTQRAYPDDWDDTTKAISRVPGPHETVDTTATHHTFELHLDRAYEVLQPSTDPRPAYAVLVKATNGGAYDAFPVNDAVGHHFTEYSLSARVTRLSLAGDVPTDGTLHRYGIRTTNVLVASEELVVASGRPLPEKVSGTRLLVSGTHRELVAGKHVIISGESFDAPDLAAAEDAVIDHVIYDAANDLSVVTLRDSLDNAYVRSKTSVFANVATATHGETVKDEILGSGDGSPWQRFSLRKKPLTYAPSATGRLDLPVESSLHVRVNGVEWSEVANFSVAGPSDRVFVTRRNAQGATLVELGDGVTGARAPTGRDNVRAVYRAGTGSAGELDAGAISQLVDSVPGVQSIVSPIPTSGAAEAETIEGVRVNAPASLRTLGRAVSLDDYAAIARSFPGVRRARAGWVQQGRSGRPLPRPAIRVTIGTRNGKPLAQQSDYRARLRRFFDASRDVNVPLQLSDFEPVYVDCAVTVDVTDDHGRAATLAAAIRALSPRTNPDGSPGFFAELDFGEPVRLSAIYAALQQVDGIRDAHVTTLRTVGPGPAVDPSGTVRDTIIVGPTQLAIVDDDPTDVRNEHGKLVVELGEGGFVE